MIVDGLQGFEIRWGLSGHLEHGKICAGEFAVITNGGSVVCAGSFFFGEIPPQADLLEVHADFSAPLVCPAIQKHAFEFARAVASLPLIAGVLPICADAKIVARVVEAVTIAMIDFHSPIRDTHNQAVHFDVMPIDRCAQVDVVFGFVNLPNVGRNERAVAVVNEDWVAADVECWNHH